MNESLDFLNVHFWYDTLAKPLFTGFTVRFPLGWTGIVGANGAGKSTLLRLAVGELSPLAGTIERPHESVYCEQRTDSEPETLRHLLLATDPDACQIRGRLGLEPDWADRWDTLSHGERKRAQIALAFWRQPAVLALDEPSNHIDADARDMLLDALRTYRGIGLLVSHDRELLDGLCRQCVFLEHGKAELRRGGYTKGKAQGDARAAELRRQHAQARRKLQRIQREMSRRRERAAAEPRMRSKRKLARGDSDGRAKINGARVADSKSGASLRQLEGRADQAARKLAAIRIVKEDKMGVWLPDARSRRDLLFRIESGRIRPGPDGPTLQFPELAMPSDGRVALVGPNGAGKTSLLQHIVQSLNLPPDRILYMPQEIAAGDSQRILNEVRALDHERLGRVLDIVNRLGSEVEPVLQTSLPSPGEIRKILLALGIVRACHLILLDEPTNHLDLPSIECLERALANCPCAMLLVSHDRQFLERLTTTRWQIKRVSDRQMELQIMRAWD